jgi:hypothetical protein
MKREYFNLARAIAAEESPCIPCINWGECYEKKLACEAYNNYYETGEIMGNKEPTTTIYKGIFNVGPGST